MHSYMMLKALTGLTTRSSLRLVKYASIRARVNICTEYVSVRESADPVFRKQFHLENVKHSSSHLDVYLAMQDVVFLSAHEKATTQHISVDQSLETMNIFKLYSRFMASAIFIMSHYVLQSERCSFPVQAWCFHMQTMRVELWDICPPSNAVGMFSDLLRQTLDTLTLRYLNEFPSCRRTEQFRSVYK